MMDKSVPNYRAIMIKYDVDNYPRFSLPEGFYITGYQPGFEKQWAEIEFVQQCMESPEKAEEIFRNEFMSQPQWLYDRCLFVVEEKTGTVAAVTSLWLGQLTEEEPPHARVHWVATREEYQGLGLIKAMFTHILDLYHKLGDKGYIYLTTQSQSYVAINIYKKFGFVPYWGELHGEGSDFDLETHKKSWQIIDGKIAEYKAGK